MKQNFSVNENVSIIDLVSGIKIPDCSKLAKNGKNGDEVIICRNEVTVKFFWSCRNSFAEFRHWLKFHVNIMTGSWVKTVFVYKEFDQKSRNQEYPRLSFVQYQETGPI